METLDESAILNRPNEVANAIGNQILHLCGNLHQYVISSLGNQNDIRSRPLEFSERNVHSKKELISLINQTVAAALNIIASVAETALLKVLPVPTYSFSGVQVLIHATEHFSYHTGQIAFWTKYLTNKDLGFYAHQDLNRKDR